MGTASLWGVSLLSWQGTIASSYLPKVGKAKQRPKDPSSPHTHFFWGQEGVLGFTAAEEAVSPAGGTLGQR